MTQYLLDSHPLDRVQLQKFAYKVFSRSAETDILRERIVAHSNPVVSDVDIVFLILERKPPNHQCICDDSVTPQVDLIRMALAVQDLWGDIVGGSTYRPPSLVVRTELSRKSQIAHPDLHFVTQEQVAQL